MNEPVIDIRNLCFAYDGRETLRDVNLRLGPGERLAVLGPNGGGKTTLVKIILGLLAPASGTVSVFGLPPARAAGRIGYVPQRVEEGAQRRELPVSVLDVVLMGLLRGWRLGWRRKPGEVERAERALERVDMLPLAGRRFSDLSGGQQQRALIARALVSDPGLLILDEPTANIDPQGKYCFFDVLTRLGKDMAMVAVSHDLSVLAASATGAACVNRRLIQNDAPRLTPEMLALLYGEHQHPCPMDAYLHALPAGLGDLRRGAS